jgi:hypothetical protein
MKAGEDFAMVWGMRSREVSEQWRRVSARLLQATSCWPECWHWAILASMGILFCNAKIFFFFVMTL